MSKKKIAALLAALLVTVSCLSACTNQNNTNTKGGNSVVSTAKADEEPKVVTKIFEPRTHLYNRIYTYNTGWDKKRQINVPDGYEVFEIIPYITTSGSGGYTKGFEVWFINVETVEATQGTISTDMNKTEKGYYNPGIVVKKETTLELTNGN